MLLRTLVLTVTATVTWKCPIPKSRRGLKDVQTEVIILKVLDFFTVAFDPRTQPRTKCLEAPRSWLRSIEGLHSWLRSIDYFSQREK